MKKNIFSVLFLLTAIVVFLVPSITKAEQYFWSTSPVGVYNTFFLPNVLFNNGGYSVGYFNYDFVNGEDFINANFIDVRLSIDELDLASYGGDKLILKVGRTTSGYPCGYGASPYCTIISTSTPISLQEMYDAGVASTTWTRFYFSEPFSWVWGENGYEQLEIQFACANPTITINCTDYDIFHIYYRVSEVIPSYSMYHSFYGSGEPFIRIGRLDSEDIVTIQRPVNGLYAAPVESTTGQYSISPWIVTVPPELATTTLKVVVDYGHAAGSYLYDDEYTIYYSATSYSVPVAPGVDFSLGAPILPHNWYARPSVYADYDNDSIFDDLVQQGFEISFVYYPGSILFSDPGFGTTTGNSLVIGATTNSFGSTTCPQGLTCTGTDGTQFWVDNNGDIHVVESTTTVNVSGFSKFYWLWGNLMYKFPWGYATRIADLVNTFGSSTATTTMFVSTSTNSWIPFLAESLRGFASVFAPILYPIRLVTSTAMWGGTAFLSFKIIMLML